MFNVSALDLWQVPRDAYKQVLVSRSELLARMEPRGSLGEHLFKSVDVVAHEMQALGWMIGETFVLGDSPLVLLSALLTSFDPSPSSCEWVERPRYRMLDSGRYDAMHLGPPLRIFRRLDTRLLLEDLYAKVARHAAETL